MSDITCAKCGEPWDSFGVREAHDMTPGEARRFLKGQGCPCCQFGEACPTCNGSGKTRESFGPVVECCQNGTVVGWRPTRDRHGPDGFTAGEWYTGYRPNVRHLAAVEVIREITTAETADGPVREAWIVCPTCAGNDPKLVTCPRCRGSGKIESSPEEADALELDACRSDMDSSDGEPVGIMNRRGLSP